MADLPILSDEGAQQVEIVQSSTLNKLAVSSLGSIQPPSDTSGSGTIAALNASVIAATNGCSSIVFIVTGTWVATLTIQGSVDGTNFVTTPGVLATGGRVTLVSANQNIIVPCGGFQKVRLTATAYTSGTATINYDTSLGINATVVFNNDPGDLQVAQGNAGSQPWLENLTQIGGTALALGQTTMAASIPVVIASNQSTQNIQIEPTARAVYSSAVTTLTPPATPTDMVTIIGSATKTIRVLYIELFSTQTLSGTNTFFIVNRSAADTGGTSTTPTIVPWNSGSAAATSVVRQYTVNPAGLGASVGTVMVAKITTPAAASLTNDTYIFDFTRNGVASGFVLQGAAQTLALNFNGAALPSGLAISVNVIWTEE